MTSRRSPVPPGPRSVVAALGVALSVAWSGGPVQAQADEAGARIDPATGALALELSPLLDDGGLRRALHSGLPIRVEVDVELWRDGFFDQQEAGGTWRASIIHDAVSGSYEFQIAGEEAVSLPSMERVSEALQAGFRSEVRPAREGRYYYLAEVEMQTLSLSDLEELRRWLQGDLGPAVEGAESPESAVAKGLRRIMVRALRLPARRERLRTPTFDWPPGDVDVETGGPARHDGRDDSPPSLRAILLRLPAPDPGTPPSATGWTDVSTPPCAGPPEKPAG